MKTIEELLTAIEITEGEIAEAKFFKDHQAVVRLTAKLDQLRAEVRDLRDATR